jgi:N6-adenosine-specific RNA methylase IME4
MFDGLPRNHFHAIAADPPWHFKARTAIQSANWKSPRHVERHYPTMSDADIKAMPVGELASKKGCHLFLWTTGPQIPAALEVMAAWGFKFSTMAFTWAKLKRSKNAEQFGLCRPIADDFHTGLGLTTRKNAEFVLLGRRGSPKRLAKDVRELIVAPVREHSRKPDEFFARVERYCDGPFLELFGRQSRPGWTVWGNQAQKFDETPPLGVAAE